MFIDCWIETDASLEGWGSKFNEQFAGGRWSKDESSHHINFLELLAIFLSLKTFFTIHQLISFFESSLINTIDSKLPKEFLKAETLFLSKFL
jgi:hypothetical protein